MAASKLRQVLTIFEEAKNPQSINSIAKTLQVSAEQVQSMLEYWVRKGRIRQVVDTTDCGTCGGGDSCPFVIELPHSYELASDTMVIPLQSINSVCAHKVNVDR